METERDVCAASTDATSLPDTVAVVITTYNDAAFLRDAILSVLAQTRPVDHIIIVDDGSEVSPATIVEEFPDITFVRKSNGGLSSARNYGLQLAQSRYISFLDADDTFEPQAIATGIACFQRAPHAAMVYGGHRRVNVGGTPIGIDHFIAAGEDVYADLLVTNFIGMHATVLYRRDLLQELGGFDETLRMCEDYDLYLRLARRFPIASHPDIIAEYRRHQQNMSSNNGRMREAVLRVHGQHAQQEQRFRRRSWHLGQQNWNHCYRDEPRFIQYTSKVLGSSEGFVQKVERSLIRRLKDRLRGGRLHRLYRRYRKTWPPAFGDIRFGDLASIRPVSRDFGYDRGNPIDRYYIENFLETRSADVQGHVLEVAEDTYSKRFGGTKITKQDVLHLNLTDPPMTIVGDLTVPGVLPDNTFDCIIITQTLQMIFNLDDAVDRMHAALKPGGVLLLTVPGITQLEGGEWGEAWCWSFTQTSIRKLFGKRFAPESMDIVTHGNCFASIAYLFGAALEEIDTSKLDPVDLTYPVIVTLRAQKS